MLHPAAGLPGTAQARWEPLPAAVTTPLAVLAQRVSPAQQPVLPAAGLVPEAAAHQQQLKQQMPGLCELRQGRCVRQPLGAGWQLLHVAVAQAHQRRWQPRLRGDPAPEPAALLAAVVLAAGAAAAPVAAALELAAAAAQVVPAAPATAAQVQAEPAAQLLLLPAAPLLLPLALLPPAMWVQLEPASGPAVVHWAPLAPLVLLPSMLVLLGQTPLLLLVPQGAQAPLCRRHPPPAAAP